MSRSRSFASNALWSLSLQATNIIVAFLVPRIVISFYGSSVNGLVTSLTQFVSYISLVEAGISAAAIYALYKPLARSDNRKTSIIVSAAKKFYYKSGYVFVALIAVLAFVYPLFVDCGDVSNVQVILLVLSLGSMGILDFFTLAKYRVLLTAAQRNWVIQIATIIYKILNAAVIVILAYCGLSVEIVYVAAILPVILRSFVLSAYTKRKFSEINFKADSGDYKLPQRWDAFYLQILGVVQNGAPVIIATFVLRDLALVSVFSIYLLIANGVQQVCSSLTTGTQASFGDVIARRQSSVLKSAYGEFQTLVYSVNAFLCGVALVLINSFVDLYTSDIAEFSYVYTDIGILVVLNVFLYHLKTPQGLLVIAAGMYRETRLQTTVQTVILLVCSIIGGIVWGIPGIMCGCCLSNIYRDIDLMIFIPMKLTKTKVASTGFKMLCSLVQFLAIAVPGMLVMPFADSWLQWIVYSLFVCMWGVAVSLLVCFVTQRRDLFKILKRIKQIFKKEEIG